MTGLVVCWPVPLVAGPGTGVLNMWTFVFSGQECACCSHTEVQVPPAPTGYVVTPRLSFFLDVMG